MNGWLNRWVGGNGTQNKERERSFEISDNSQFISEQYGIFGNNK